MHERKKSVQGFDKRMNLLAKVLPEAETIAELALTAYRRKAVARDVIVDALVALATATPPLGMRLAVPANPQLDSRRRPMQMAYALTFTSATGPC